MLSVVVLMSIFASLVISSEAATIRDYEEFPGSNIIKDMCPTVGSTAAEYRVSVIADKSSESLHIGGCAFINKSPDALRRSLGLWIGSLNNGMQHCPEEGMEHFNFSCVSESPSAESDEFMKGIMFAQLFSRVNNKENKPIVRCAIHDMVKGNASMFRIAISENDSCHGLADLLQSHLQTTVPDGAMVLQLTRTRLVSEPRVIMRRVRSTSNGHGNIKIQLTDPSDPRSVFWNYGK